jgi:hypothetical protein
MVSILNIRIKTGKCAWHFSRIYLYKRKQVSGKKLSNQSTDAAAIPSVNKT